MQSIKHVVRCSEFAVVCESLEEAKHMLSEIEKAGFCTAVHSIVRELHPAKSLT